jgi:cytochrome c biogenesis protein ResB
VNHPVRHGGFRFYQSNVDDHERPDPQASVLQIVDDPGIPVVYGGLAMMFLGIVWMLVIEPARRGRERRRARGEAVAPAPVGKEELVDVR